MMRPKMKRMWLSPSGPKCRRRSADPSTYCKRRRRIRIQRRKRVDTIAEGGSGSAGTQPPSSERVGHERGAIVFRKLPPSAARSMLPPAGVDWLTCKCPKPKFEHYPGPQDAIARLWVHFGFIKGLWNHKVANDFVSDRAASARNFEAEPLACLSAAACPP